MKIKILPLTTPICGVCQESLATVKLQVENDSYTFSYVEFRCGNCLDTFIKTRQRRVGLSLEIEDLR